MTHEAFDSEAHKAFWQYPADWPLDRSGFVFLGRAVHRFGSAMFGDEWTGEEPALAVDDESEEDATNWPAITRAYRVQAEIARRCEAGALAYAVHLHSGALGVMRPGHWRNESWRAWFDLCQLDPEDLDLSSLRHWGIVRGALCKLFLKSDDLAAAIAEVSADRVSRTPQATPLPWRAVGRVTHKVWIQREDVIVEATARLAASREDSNKALSRALSAMWAESGQTGGSPGTFEQVLRGLGFRTVSAFQGRG